MRRTQPTHRARIALNFVLGDQVKYQLPSLTRQPDHPPAHLGSKARNGVIGRRDQSWIDLPAIAP